MSLNNDNERRNFNLRKPGSKNRTKNKQNESETRTESELETTTGVASGDTSPELELEPSVRRKEPGTLRGSARQSVSQAPIETAEPSTRELIAMMSDLKETVTSMFRNFAVETNDKMDTVIADFASFRSDLAEMTTKVTELESSVENASSRISSFENSKLPDLNKKIDNVKEVLEEKLLLYEIHNRKLNLLIYGVTQRSNENIYETVATTFAHLLNIPRDQAEKIPLTNAHRVPRGKNPVRPGPVDNQQTRAASAPDPIIVRFCKMTDRDRVLQAFERPKPRGDPTGAAAPGATEVSRERITVRTDLPPGMKRERGRLATIAYQIRQRQKVSTRIIVNKTKIILQTRKKTENGRPDPWLNYKE